MTSLTDALARVESARTALGAIEEAIDAGDASVTPSAVVDARMEIELAERAVVAARASDLAERAAQHAQSVSELRGKSTEMLTTSLRAVQDAVGAASEALWSALADLDAHWAERQRVADAYWPLIREGRALRDQGADVAELEIPPLAQPDSLPDAVRGVLGAAIMPTLTQVRQRFAYIDLDSANLARGDRHWNTSARFDLERGQ